MEIKLVVTDIDGTLIDPTEKIPQDLVDAVVTCREKGIRFALATGRTRELVRPIMAKLGITDPCVLANGACIFQGDTCIKSHGFVAAPILHIIREADQEGLTVTCSDEYQEQAIRQTAYVKAHQKLGGRFQSNLSLEETDWETKRFQKIMLMDENRTGAIKKYQEWLKEYSQDYWVTTYSDMAVELGPEGCNKATGIRELAALLGVDMSQVMACGDFLNDLEMIREAGIGVAVGNATEALKQEADYVARAEYCYGVIEAMEKFCF